MVGQGPVSYLRFGQFGLVGELARLALELRLTLAPPCAMRKRNAGEG